MSFDRLAGSLIDFVILTFARRCRKCSEAFKLTLFNFPVTLALAAHFPPGYPKIKKKFDSYELFSSPFTLVLRVLELV